MSCDPRVHDKEWVQREGMVSFAGYPLVAEGRVMGVMALFASQELAEDTLEVLASVAGAIAQGIQRERAGEALVQSEERYRAVVEQAAEGIFLFDAATGGIFELNAAFKELLGYTAEEILSMTIYDLVAHERESIERNIQRILDEGSRFVGERRYRCKDGSLVDVEVTASLISYGGKWVICTVVRDVTEQATAAVLCTTLDALAARVVQSTAAVACS